MNLLFPQKRWGGYVYLSVCTSDPVYDEVSSFNDSAGYVAERIKNCTIFQLWLGGCYSSSLFSRNLSAERMGDSNGMGWGEIVISTENGTLFRFFCLIAFSI